MGAGRKLYATLSILGVNVLTSEPNKKTWLQTEKEKISKMRTSWANFKIAKTRGASFLSRLKGSKRYLKVR